MSVEPDELSNTLARGGSFSAKDRAIHDRSVKEKLVACEVAALGFLLEKLMSSPPDDTKDLMTAIQALSRAIYMHSSKPVAQDEDPFDLAALGEHVRASMAGETQ
jgi:hypothetical protein